MKSMVRVAALAMPTLLAACQSGGDFASVDINLTLGDQLIVPSFAKAAASSQAMASTVAGFCASPATASKADVQAAWKLAWKDWQAASVFQFGPMDDEQRLRIEFFPDERNLVEKQVDAMLAASTPPTEDTVEKGTAPIQGFPAVEYLLFAQRTTTPNDCAALTAISAHLSRRLTQTSDAWATFAVNEFAKSGDAGLQQLVEAIKTEVVTVRDNELGIPLGQKSGNAPQAALASSPYAQESIPAMQAELDTMAAILSGPNGVGGLADRIRENGGEQYTNNLLQLIQSTRDELGRVQRPFGDAVVDNSRRQQLYAIFDGSFKTLRDAINQLGPAVGVSTGFNATDGD